MTIRTTTRKVMTATIVIGATATLTACGSAPVELQSVAAAARLDCDLPTGPVVIVGTARANAAAPEVTPAVGSALAVVEEQAAGAEGGYLALYDTDGDPGLVLEQAVRFDAKNDYAREDQVQDFRAGVANAITAEHADDPETDPLGAITLAAREIQGRGGAGTIVVIDSGLQTTGAFTFTDPATVASDPADLAAALGAAGQLPDLTGITVLFVGLGDVAGDQEALTTAQRARLVSQWTVLAEAAGAGCVVVDETPLGATPDGSLPPVTTVRLPAPPALALPPVGESLRLGDEVIGFKPDSAEFRDPEAVRNALRPVADAARSGSHQIELVGTTASALTEAQRLDLSERRAQAVRDLLVDMGVPAGSITAKGVGTDHPLHVPDTNPDGSLIPDQAVRNRAVFLTVVARS